eukprot:TRINITY_DN4458_c0_g1_i1.p1 TRINITY_DN4458_c0_g1~~TRINITY_DN4458_c0_g1_i1.p1  ORF type:complete len:350 (-),score=140.61 TRINITY_DN4458_c0_g1_i1:20-1069(-)
MSEEEDFSLSFLDSLKFKTLKELSEKMELEIENKKKGEAIESIINHLGYAWFEKAVKYNTVQHLKTMLKSFGIKADSSKKNLLIKDLLQYIKENSFDAAINKLDEKFLKSVIFGKILDFQGEYKGKKDLCHQIRLSEIEFQLSILPHTLLLRMCKDNKLDVEGVGANKLMYCLLQQKIITKTPLRRQSKKINESESSVDESMEVKKSSSKRKRSSTSSRKEEKKKEEKRKERGRDKKKEEKVKKSKSKKKKSKKNEEEIDDEKSSEEKSSLDDDKQDDENNKVQKNLLDTLNNDNRAYTITGKLSLKRNTLIDLIKKRGYVFTEDIKEATHVVSNDPFYNTKNCICKEE